MNGMERRTGFDLNGDGYIGGEGEFYHRSLSLLIILLCLGFLGRLERATHIDFNGDNMIGRRPDVYYGGGGYPSMGYGGGYPSMGYGGGGYPSMGYGGYSGYGGSPYGYY